MDLSRFKEMLPPGVELAVVERTEQPDFEIYPEEVALLSEKASQNRTSQFRMGRHAAHRALRGLGVDQVPILRGARREPIWPVGVVGSITHDGIRAVALVAKSTDSAGIGIDLEDGSRYFPGLEDKIAGAREIAALEKGGRSRQDAVIELFSAKESIYKAFYPRVGRFFGFEAARIEFGPGHLTGYFTEMLDPLYPTDRPMRIGRLWDSGTVLTWLVLPPD